jgi:hypothetical protein
MAEDEGTEAGEEGQQQQQTVLPGTTARKLEDLLSTLDESDRDAVLGEVSKARKEAAGYRTKVKELEPMAARAKALEDAQKSAEEIAREKALDSDLKALGYRDRAVAAEVKALAAENFADPADASHFLDLKDFVDDDGEIDTSEISKALDSLLKSKPHLAKPEGRPVLRPDRSQGSSGNGAAPDPAEEFGAFIQNQLKK